MKTPSPFRFAIPAVAWTLFFVLSALVITNVLKVTWFGGVLIVIFFVVAIFSTMFVATNTPKQ